MDFKTEEKIQQLKDLLKKVDPNNQEQAKRYVSEGVLDLKFIDNPSTEVVSLRIGHIKNMITNKGEER